MSMFSSRPPFNDDPEPWRSTLGKGRFSRNVGYCKHDPRPKFDRPQHNPTNPILAKLRSLKSPHRANWIQGFMEQSERVRFPNWSDNQVTHARRVLTRLAKLTKESA